MILRRLTTAEAAARLGVKPATLYAYVSRGILSWRPDAAGQHFDPQEWPLAWAGRPARRRGTPASPGWSQAWKLTGISSPTRTVAHEANDLIFVSRFTTDLASLRASSKWPDAVELEPVLAPSRVVG